MDTEKNGDLFSDIDFGSFDKYARTNKEAERREKAKEADERIAKFASRTKDLEWAREALVFCERELENGKDIVDISQGIKALGAIKAEAEEIIENDRIAKIKEAEERERLRLQKIQEEENARRAKINELDQAILKLLEDSISYDWCSQVELVAKRIDDTSNDIRAELKSLSSLEKMKSSLKQVRQGLDISDKINELKKKTERDTSWATLVVEILNEVNDDNRKYVKDLELVQGYLKEALRIIRSPQIEKFNSFLKLVEGGVLSKEDIKQYKELSKQKKALSYDMGEYIDGFNTIWDKAESLVNSEIKRHAELERKQKEEEEKRRLYKQRQPIIDKYEKILVSIEAGKKSQAIIDEFHNLNFYSATQGFSLGEYIDMFDSRWSRAYSIIEKEKRRLAELERKQREEEEKRRIDRERQSVAKEFEDILLEVETGYISSAMIDRFNRYNSTIYSFDYLENYINSFNTRWSKAHNAVLKEQQRLADIEIKRRIEEENRVLRERQPKINMYKSCLERVESELGRLSEEAMTRFETLDKESKYLGFSMWNYIYDFDSRWKKARAIVKEERLRISRKPDIDEYTSFLEKIIMSDCTVSDLIDKFDYLNTKLGWIGYKLSKYIPDFDIKWTLASGKIEKEKQRAREFEIERKKKEEQERERKELAERRKQESLKTLKKVLIISAIVAGALAVLGGIVALLVLVEPSRHYVASALICGAYIAVWTILRARAVSDGFCFLFNIGMAIASIVLICVSDVTVIYGVGTSLAIMVTSVIMHIFAWNSHTIEEEKEYNRYTGETEVIKYIRYRDSDYQYSLIGISAGGILFSIAFGLLFSGLAEVIIIGCGISASVIALCILQGIFVDKARDNKWACSIAIAAMCIIALIVAFILSFQPIYNLCLCGLIIAIGMVVAVVVRIFVSKNAIWLAPGTWAVIVLISCAVAFSQARPVSEVPIIENGVLVAYTGEAEEFVVPDEVHTIGQGAFKHNSPQNKLKRVVLHDNIKEIGIDAFRGCYALSEITIPGSVEQIGATSFMGCTGLTSVVLEQGVKGIGVDAFKECTALTAISIPGSIESIGVGAFSHCKGISSVTIEVGTLHIGEYAFYECDNLGKVTFPSGLLTMGQYAFANSEALSSITIPGSVSAVGLNAFEACTKLSTVVVENGVTDISDRAFYECTALNSVKLSGSVERIGRHAFYNCIALTEIRLPSGLKIIDDYAFFGCDNLESVSMPYSVTTFGDEIFDSYPVTIYYQGSQSQWDKIEKDWLYWSSVFNPKRKVIFNQYK